MNMGHQVLTYYTPFLQSNHWTTASARDMGLGSIWTFIWQSYEWHNRNRKIRSNLILKKHRQELIKTCSLSVTWLTRPGHNRVYFLSDDLLLLVFFLFYSTLSLFVYLIKFPMNNSGSYGMEHLVEWYVEMVHHDK